MLEVIESEGETMVGIPRNLNIPSVVNQTLYGALNAGNNASSAAVTAESVYNMFFKDVKTKKEFRTKIKKTLRGLNSTLEDKDIEGILESLDTPDQPPFCASYSEEGVSDQLSLQDSIIRADIYDILLMLYNDIYKEAKENNI